MDPPAAGLTLLVERGPRKGETVGCRPGRRIRIGRVVRGNNFTIKDAGISQAHISIEVDDGTAGWVLRDLGSSNGTLLNDVRVAPSVPTRLRDGDAIKIGEVTAMRVRIEGEEVPAPCPGPRQKPGRGRGATVAEAPREDGVDGARRRGRSRKLAVADGGTAFEDERSDPVGKECSRDLRKTASRRGRQRGRGAAAAIGCLDTLYEEARRVDIGLPENGSRREMNQELADLTEVIGAEESGGGRGRGRSASEMVLSNVGAQKEEHMRQKNRRENRALLGGEEDVGVAGADQGAETAGEDMDKMTLDEWFDRMEKYIPKVINQVAEEVISEIKAKAVRFNEYVASCEDPGQRDLGAGFVGPI